MAKIRKHLDPANCVMSLGDHLEELRTRLVLALLGLFLGMIVCLIPPIGTRILRIIEWPYYAATGARAQDQAKKTEVPQVEKEALALVETFFKTLNAQLAKNRGATSVLDPNQVALLHDTATQTIQAWVQENYVTADKTDPLVTLSPPEAFMAYMKVSLVSGALLTAPWIVYQIWMFVAAGLYPKERRYVYKAVPFSAGLFVVGALFFLFVIARITLGFFLGFGDSVGVASQWTLQKYISFVTVLMLVFGIAFQTPIAVFILVRTGLVPIATLRSYRKYVLLGLAFVSAVATPPDVVSQIALLIPLYCLYELGIILSIFAEKKARQKKAESETPAA
jgi:sec-independent protein translocase protein TatC